MSSARLLRSEATAALTRARKACSLALKEARIVASTRCELIKSNELRRARDACQRVEKAAKEARDAYLRARPPVSEAKQRAQVRRRERREMTRRDAVVRVMQDRDVPERVAELAVRAAERKPLRGVDIMRKWEALAERAGDSAALAAAWRTYEREAEQRIPPRSEQQRALKKRAKKKRSKRGAKIQPVGRPVSIERRKRPAVSAPAAAPTIIVLEDDVPF